MRHGRGQRLVGTGSAGHEHDPARRRSICGWSAACWRRTARSLGTAAGAAALGDPAVAVAWLANQLATFDIPLKAGEIIMPGALTKAEVVARGDVVRATYDRLGSVSVKFV